MINITGTGDHDRTELVIMISGLRSGDAVELHLGQESILEHAEEAFNAALGLGWRLHPMRIVSNEVFG